MTKLLFFVMCFFSIISTVFSQEEWVNYQHQYLVNFMMAPVIYAEKIHQIDSNKVMYLYPNRLVFKDSLLVKSFGSVITNKMFGNNDVVIDSNKQAFFYTKYEGVYEVTDKKITKLNYSSNLINHISVAPNNFKLACYNGSGISFFNAPNWNLKLTTQNSAIPSDFINCGYALDTSHYVLGYSGGIFYRKNNKVLNFDLLNYIDESAVFDMEYFNGLVYFITPNYLGTFNLNDLSIHILNLPEKGEATYNELKLTFYKQLIVKCSLGDFEIFTDGTIQEKRISSLRNPNHKRCSFYSRKKEYYLERFKSFSTVGNDFQITERSFDFKYSTKHNANYYIKGNTDNRFFVFGDSNLINPISFGGYYKLNGKISNFEYTDNKVFIAEDSSAVVKILQFSRLDSVVLPNSSQIVRLIKTDNGIYIGGNKDVAFYDFKTSQFMVYPEVFDEIIEVELLQNGQLYIQDKQRGLLLYSLIPFNLLRNITGTLSFPKSRMKVQQTSRGELYGMSLRGLHYFNGIDWKPYYIPESMAEGFDFFIDPNNTFWTNGFGKIYKLIPAVEAHSNFNISSQIILNYGEIKSEFYVIDSTLYLTQMNSLYKYIGNVYNEPAKTDLNPVYHELLQNFPNPANDFTKIEYKLGNHEENVVFRVINLQGTVVFEKKLTNAERKGYFFFLDVRNYPQGLYTYQLQTSTKILEKKMIVVH